MHLSPKKQRFVDFIKNFTDTNDRSPTFIEIMKGLGIRSLGTINWYVCELEKCGIIKRTRGYNGKRALSVPEHNVSDRLPLLGVIAAGYPLEVFEDNEYVEVPASYVQPDNYVLRVRGDSMINDNIQDDDYVIIRRTIEAAPGQTIVAYVNNEATLKRYYPKAVNIELHPRNPEYNIIHVSPEDDFRIGGVVLGIVRRYDD